MFGPWTAFVGLAATLLPLLWAQRWITRHIQILGLRWVNDSDVALLLYFVVVLPGVVIHELSHWLMARLLRVRVGKFQIGPARGAGRGGRVSLGSVRIGRVDPVRASLIGVAPLLGGTAVILLIGNSILGVDELLGSSGGQAIEGVLAGLGELARVADFWIWLYLIFAISNAMLPSESDMTTVRPVLIFLGIVGGILLILTGLPSLPAGIVHGARSVAGYLAYAFGLTLAVDAVFMIVIGLLELLTIWIRGR